MIFKNLLEEIKKKKLFKETIWSFLAKGITFLLVFATNIFLARFLGVERLGLWSFFLGILSIILLLSYGGINASATKYIAEHNKTSNLRNVLKSSFKIRVLFSLIFSALLLFLYKPLIILIGRPELENLFLWAVPLVFLSGLTEYLKAVFTGLHRNKYNFIINFIEYGLKLILLVCFLMFSNNLISVVNSYSLALFITVAVGFYLFYFNFYKDLKYSNENFDRNIFKYSIPLFFISMGFWMATELDVVMIGFIKGNYEVGIYSVAKEIIIKLPHIALAISMGTMPLFAKINTENKEALKKLFYKLLKINTIIFGSIAFLLIFFSWFFIPLFYGKNYAGSVLPLQLLTPYLVMFSYSIFLSSFLDYRGLAKKRAINLSIAIILNIVLNFILIPQYGASGAAIATSISYAPYVFLNWIEVKKALS
jgi:O-antigen/teichoic acid export membrane protein